MLIHKHSKSRGPFATKINERGDPGSPSSAVVPLELDQPQLRKSLWGFLIGQGPLSRQPDLLGIIHCGICMPLSSQVSRCERGRAYITTKNSLTVRLFCAEFRTKPRQCNTHGNCPLEAATEFHFHLAGAIKRTSTGSCYNCIH